MVVRGVLDGLGDVGGGEDAVAGLARLEALAPALRRLLVAFIPPRVSKSVEDQPAPKLQILAIATLICVALAAIRPRCKSAISYPLLAGRTIHLCKSADLRPTRKSCAISGSDFQRPADPGANQSDGLLARAPQPAAPDHDTRPECQRPISYAVSATSRRALSTRLPCSASSPWTCPCRTRCRHRLPPTTRHRSPQPSLVGAACAAASSPTMDGSLSLAAAADLMPLVGLLLDRLGAHGSGRGR